MSNNSSHASENFFNPDNRYLELEPDQLNQDSLTDTHLDLSRTHRHQASKFSHQKPKHQKMKNLGDELDTQSTGGESHQNRGSRFEHHSNKKTKDRFHESLQFPSKKKPSLSDCDLPPAPVFDRRNSMAAKVSSDLITLQESNQSSDADLASVNSLLQISGDQVYIDAVAAENASTLLADLAALGLQNASVFGRVVSGSISISSINEIAAIESLKFVRPAYQPIRNVGAVTSEGDSAMNADEARSLFNVDGTGITIGVLSDSLNYLGGAAADTLSGDLPATINVLEDSWGKDEGRAMLQLIHDVAPGANLAFHTAIGGMANFATGILALAEAGAMVIVDDISYLSEPMFQDGLISSAVDTVFANGVAYFSSAGNQGRLSYESTFNDSGETFVAGELASAPNAPLFYGGTAHDFDLSEGIDTLQSFTLAPGQIIRLSFQWDEAFFSVSGGVGATNEMDIYVLDEAGATILGGKADANFGGDPLEVFSFRNTTTTTNNYNFAILHDTSFGGIAPSLMKYAIFGADPTQTLINEYATNSSTIFGHANAAGAQAVGAAHYSTDPQTNLPTLENFSSYGSTPILFDVNGNRLDTPELRATPHIVAPDGTSTTVPGFEAFFGTSAAAPHAAAVAALLRQAAPNLTPASLYTALQSTAIDMDDPSTLIFDTGFDQATGYGFIDAVAALEAVSMPTVSVSVPTTRFVSEEPGNPGEFIISRTGSTTFPLTVNYTLAGTATNGIDYRLLNGSVTIPAGITTFRMPVLPIDDVFIEGDETLELSLAPDPAYNLGINNTASLTIIDNDIPTVIVSAEDTNVGETGTDPGQIIFSRSSSLGDLTINYTIIGTATNGTDYRLISNSITIPDGATTATLAINPIDDTLIEPAETVTISLSESTDYNLVGNANVATVTITDNDIIPLDAGGNDTITGGNNNNTIYGGGGNDRIIVGNGNNTIHGGPGDDWIFVGNGNNTVFGGGGNDTIIGGTGNNNIFGGDGVDIIDTNGGLNNIDQDGSNGRTFAFLVIGSRNGTAGNDIMNGTIASETIVALEGNDIIVGNGGNDILFGDRATL